MHANTELMFWHRDPSWYRLNPETKKLEMTKDAPERAVKSFEAWRAQNNPGYGNINTGQSAESQEGGRKMNITAEQKALLREYNIYVFEDINDTLLELDAKITEVGFDDDYSLNKEGLKLQRLYDELYCQN